MKQVMNAKIDKDKNSDEDVVEDLEECVKRIDEQKKENDKILQEIHDDDFQPEKMAAVGARYHRGDGGNDPSRRPCKVTGGCEASGSRNVRDKTSLDEFERRFKEEGSLEIDFHFQKTYKPWGRNRDVFLNLLSSIVRNLPLNFRYYRNLPKNFHQAAYQRLRRYFNLAAHNHNGIYAILQSCIQEAYRNKKNKIKTQWYIDPIDAGASIDEIFVYVSDGLDQNQWNDLLDFYQDPRNERIAETNSINRENQQVNSSQGSQSFSSLLYDYAQANGGVFPSPIDWYGMMHRPRRAAIGPYNSPEAGETHKSLLHAREAFTQANGRAPTNDEEERIMRETLDFRWGHARGVETRPRRFDNPKTGRDV